MNEYYGHRTAACIRFMEFTTYVVVVIMNGPPCGLREANHHTDDAKSE